MGCTTSRDPGHNCANGECRYKANLLIGNSLGPKAFTAEEVAIIKETWDYLAKDIQGNGLQIFLRIFELCPGVKTLFFFDDVRHTEIAKNTLIKAHGARFMNAISAVVDNLENVEEEDNKVSKLLVLLGQQHRRHTGFRSEYFECFYEALMWQWEHCIGNQFLPQVADAWSHLFIFVMEKLLEGYGTSK